ncbi:MAG: translation initiation factor IF-2 [Candidatus Gastranaerophilales bacterium]|nr:translation initiation factor IF-2 [Candidatus Gastranaerophilales bacterium]
MRVHELAKELNITSKELIEKVNAELNLGLKSHSSTVSDGQADKIKALYKKASAPAAKPKAFIVKKQKPSETQVTEEVKKEPPVIKTVSKLEVVRSAKPVEPKKVKPVETVKPEVKKEPEAVKKPAPINNSTDKLSTLPSMTRRNFAKTDDKKPREEKEKRQDKKEKNDKKESHTQTPIKRHIIPQDMYMNQGRGGKKKKKDYSHADRQEEQERISLEKTVQNKHKKHTQDTGVQEVVTSVVIDRPMTVGELSDKIKKTPAEIIKFLMLNGVMVTVNTPIDTETSKKVAINFELEVLEEDLEAFIEQEEEKDGVNKYLATAKPEDIVKRAPVVTVMGHVDHGKTTLLDSIRASKHKIVHTEVGGITQSIGAYTVWLDKRKIVFIDTPGHEAFTQMRLRGAQSTDIAVLVVAADDGVMPQTIESISHAKSAGVPIIVAVNKIDKPDANPDKVLQELTEHNLIPEKWGGDTICIPVSALQKTGIDELLEYILLMADMQELKAVEKCPATGVIIEANLDKGKGPVATMLVQNGTLKVGDAIVAGTVGGKVRALLDDSGRRVRTAGPSTPVEILGLNEVPQAGDIFEVVKNEKEMKAIVAQRKQKERSTRLEAMTAAHVQKEAMADNQVTNLNIIIKANTNGSAEAVSSAFQNVKSLKVVPKIVHVGVGDISEADVMLASASNAIILGFTVKEDANALLSAQKEGVKIKKYDIIYQVLEDIEKTMLSLLSPEIEDVELGKAEVRAVFTVGKTTRIAGCYVTEGKIVRSKTARVLRDGVEIFKGEIDQLKRFKDDVKEVKEGFECGISFAKFNDIQEGDIIEVSTTKEVEPQTLV